jgi:hypothetical protein
VYCSCKCLTKVWSTVLSLCLSFLSTYFLARTVCYGYANVFCSCEFLTNAPGCCLVAVCFAVCCMVCLAERGMVLTPCIWRRTCLTGGLICFSGVGFREETPSKHVGRRRYEAQDAKHEAPFATGASEPFEQAPPPPAADPAPSSADTGRQKPIKHQDHSDVFR